MWSRWRTWRNSLFITTFKAAGALPSFKSGHSSRTPAALSVVMKGEFPQVLQMTPAEITFSIQLLKIQEPCPPFQMANLETQPFPPMRG